MVSCLGFLFGFVLGLLDFIKMLGILLVFFTGRLVLLMLWKMKRLLKHYCSLLTSDQATGLPIKTLVTIIFVTRRFIVSNWLD